MRLKTPETLTQISESGEKDEDVFRSQHLTKEILSRLNYSQKLKILLSLIIFIISFLEGCVF